MPRFRRAVDTSQRNQHGRLVAARHLFVCTNARGSGKPTCGPRGGDALVAAVQRELIVRGATEVLVTPCGCLGPCFDGPNAVVYPDGVWYAGLNAQDAARLADHLIDGVELAAKVSERPGAAGPDRP
jgi:(2Fe-2S) ferredoxin